MTLEFFYNNYNFNDININKMFIKNNKLNIEGIYNVYLELIANGYRPEMNMDIDKTFVFNVTYHDHHFKDFKDVKLIKEDNEYYLLINNLKLKLSGDVEII